MNPPDPALLGQHAKIAPDGHRRDLEVFHQVGNLDDAVRAGKFDDARATPFASHQPSLP